ncbi:hypothetical protein JCM3765_005874 [Sporobolomyces pararoseus]
MVFGRLRRASGQTKSEDSNKEGMLGILRGRRSKQDLVNLDHDAKDESRKPSVTGPPKLKPLGFASEDLLPSLLYNDSPPSSASSSSNPVISTSSNIFPGREVEAEEEEGESEEEEDDYGSESNHEGEITTTISTALPILSSTPDHPQVASLGPRASRLKSFTISRLFPRSSSESPLSLSPVSARAANTATSLRHDFRLETMLGRIGVLEKLGRGLTSQDTVEIEGQTYRIGQNLLAAQHPTKEEEGQQNFSRLLRDEYRPSKRPNLPSRKFSASSSRSPPPTSVLPVLPQLQAWHSRPRFASSHLVWTGTDKTGNLSVGEKVLARKLKMEEVSEKLATIVVSETASPTESVSPAGTTLPSAPSVSSPPPVDTTIPRRFVAQPSSVFGQPFLVPDIQNSASAMLQRASAVSRQGPNDMRYTEDEERKERERERVFPQGRRKQQVKEMEEDPRQKEIQKRLADQRRRSELMHTKIEPRERKPSNSEKRRSDMSQPIPIQPNLVHPSSYLAPSPPLWLAPSPIAFSQPVPLPLPQHLPRFSPPAPPFRTLSPSQPDVPILTQLSSSPPRQRQPSVPVRAQSPPSPIRPVTHRSNSTPLQPPRKLVVVPPPPPVRNELVPSLSTSPVSPPLLPTSASAATLTGTRSTTTSNRARRLSTIEPLIKDVRPPKAWSLPHAPSVSGRKTVEKETNS